MCFSGSQPVSLRSTPPVTRMTMHAPKALASAFGFGGEKKIKNIFVVILRSVATKDPFELNGILRCAQDDSVVIAVLFNRPTQSQNS